MKLISMRWSLLAMAFALLSCATPVDPLEAKASDGDPVSACLLVARSLHSCALAKQKWEGGQIASRPACIDEGIGKRQQGYLDKANAGLHDHQIGQVLFQANRVLLSATAALLQIGRADEVIESTDKLKDTCADLADLPKT
ncbi:MAG TPA: hypothetical protein VGQ35_11215 [Dongiaceae bacterium]|nr:hypothetical protein [Dongiaceae bacterium]